MPTLDKHQSTSAVKLLLLGQSGVGKTGALGSLPAAGYRLIIADFDNGLDILRDPKVMDPKYLPEVIFETFYDRHNSAGGRVFPIVDGYTRFLKALDKWTVDGQSIGGVHDWGEKDILVIDSLTFLGNVCMQEALKLSNHTGQRPTQPDWGTAIELQENIIEILYNPAVKCNVIVTAHLVELGDPVGGGIPTLYPSALGKKFPPKLARYFNNVVLLRKRGSGAAATREFITTAEQNTPLKVSKPTVVPAVMPPDLAKLFSLLKGPIPIPSTSTASSLPIGSASPTQVKV